MTTLTPTRLAQMPRVNLLPPEIAQAAKLKKLQVMLGLMVLAVMALVVMIFLLASGQVGGAEEDLSAAQAEGSDLQAEVASYAEVPLVLAEVQAAQDDLVTAMTPEVRWSFYLNDLSLTIPKSTRLSTLTAVNNAAAAQLDPTGVTALTVPTTPLGVPTMGSITFTGKSNNFDAIASWLQTLARQEGFIEPTVTSAVASEEADTVGKFYDVESTTQLSQEAASDRYLEIATGE